MSLDTITPTAERVHKAGDQYDPPAQSQKEDRPAGRVSSGFDLLARRGLITEQQHQAAAMFLHYYRGMTRMKGLVSSYGLQAWSGTTAAQEADPGFDREDWPLVCADRVKAAHKAVGNPAHWDALIYMIEVDGNASAVGFALGYKCKKQAQAVGVTVIRDVLHRLANHYRLTSQPPN